ncbi:MAG: hypothetical protein JNL70_15940 [Saprospiraceae bacterium]|nr:hypothetical protein [Saprospiraceae bacterium]
MKSLQISSIKTVLFIVLGFFSSLHIAQAGSVMKVYLTTGGDDLRGGNNAYITVNFINGTTSPEYNLGGGFANNSRINKNITLNVDVTDLSQVKNIAIRHNGSPRAGQPFDTYDNWDLQALTVTFVIRGQEEKFINTSDNPLVRFSGQLRNRVFIPTGSTPPPTTSSVKVYLTTGSDDLRGGNNAFMTVNYTDGTSSPEYSLGGGFGQNSMITKAVTINKVVASVADIKSITIRHDGSPRAGNPFDMYDNWDLQVLRVALVMPTVEQNIVNERGNPLIRYTGALRTRTWNR